MGDERTAFPHKSKGHKNINYNFEGEEDEGGGEREPHSKRTTFWIKHDFIHTLLAAEDLWHWNAMLDMQAHALESRKSWLYIFLKMFCNILAATIDPYTSYYTIITQGSILLSSKLDLKSMDKREEKKKPSTLVAFHLH